MDFLAHLQELVAAVSALVTAACVLKIVAVCIKEHENESGVKAVGDKIKRYIVVGVISVCILGITSTIAGYYGNYADQTGGGGSHTSVGGYEHGGGGGYH